MPHVIVKLWPGKSEQQKARLADKITKDVMDVFDYGEESVSVGFEEIQSTGRPRWATSIAESSKRSAARSKQSSRASSSSAPSSPPTTRVPTAGPAIRRRASIGSLSVPRAPLLRVPLADGTLVATPEV